MRVKNPGSDFPRAADDSTHNFTCRCQWQMYTCRWAWLWHRGKKVRRRVKHRRGTSPLLALCTRASHFSEGSTETLARACLFKRGRLKTEQTSLRRAGCMLLVGQETCSRIVLPSDTIPLQAPTETAHIPSDPYLELCLQGIMQTLQCKDRVHLHCNHRSSYGDILTWL